MTLDHFMQIIRHRKNVTRLPLEQLELLIEGVRDVRHHAPEALLSVHEERAPAPKGEGEDQQGEREEEESLLVRGDVKRRSL